MQGKKAECRRQQVESGQAVIRFQQGSCSREMPTKNSMQQLPSVAEISHRTHHNPDLPAGACSMRCPPKAACHGNPVVPSMCVTISRNNDHFTN